MGKNKEKTVEIDEPLFGVVTNCQSIGIFEEPNFRSDAVCNIKRLTKLFIDEENSTEDFYKVFLSSGIEGFCPKKFVALQQKTIELYHEDRKYSGLLEEE